MGEECMVCHEPTGKAGRDEDSLYTPNGVGPFCEQCWDDAWPVMVAAPDPALLALAKMGAMVLDWSPLEAGFPTIPGGVIDDMAVRSGCALEDASDGGHECWTAPGVRLAIAALLAPDAPDAAGEVARECQCRLRTRLVGDGCDVCNPELAAEYARQREVTDGD